MKKHNSVKFVVWSLVADLILIVEAVIDIRTGKTTVTELVSTVAFCIIIAILLLALMKWSKRKERERFGATGAGTQVSTGSTEE